MRRSVYILGTFVLILLSIAPVRAWQGTGELDNKTILFAVSNGEADPFIPEALGASRFGSLLARDGATLEVLNWLAPIPDSVDLVIIIAPQRKISGTQWARMWAYLERGGNLLLLADPPPAANRSALFSTDALFELLWTDFGIQILDSILIDSTSLSPVISGFTASQADHPILENVAPENLVFSGVRPLKSQQLAGIAEVTEVLLSSNSVYAESDVQGFIESGQAALDPAADLSPANFPVIVVSENPETGSRIVIIGNSEIGTNGYGFNTSPPESQSFIFPDMVQLLMNAAYWALDRDAPDLEFSPPEPTATPSITPSPSPEATATPQ